MNVNVKTICPWIVIATLATALIVSPAVRAEEAVTLRLMHFLPANSSPQKNVIEPWCEDLNKASNGRIKCEIYPSMQLGGTPAQLADIVRNGVVDVVWTALGYSAGRFPRSEALELPFMLPGGGLTASEITWAFSQSHAKKDFSDYKVLTVYSDGGSLINTMRTPVNSVGDLGSSGLRLRAPTRMASELITALGATPVSMPPAQIADTISKGVIDGAMGGWPVLPPTKLDETTYFHTETADDQATTTVTVLAMLMNKKRYHSMPDDLRDILDQYSGLALTQRFGRVWDQDIEQIRGRISADPKHKIITLDDPEYFEMKEAARPVIEHWMASNKGGVDREALIKGLKEIVAERVPNQK